MDNSPNAQLPLLAEQTEETLRAFLKERGFPAFRCQQIMEWAWKRRVESFDQMANLPKQLRAVLEEHFSLSLPQVIQVSGREGATRKFLTQLRDENCIESVIIPATLGRDGKKSERVTLCVSSQVGCLFGCKFCASGLNGWVRDLDAGEITQQILSAEQIEGQRVDNLVFMGMGEPLANYDQLIRALDIITSPAQLNIGGRHITISTSGHVENMMRLAEYPKQIRLAVSLHGATDETRDLIMPINRKWNLDELKKGLLYWSTHKKQRISLEYILIKDINDSVKAAHDLARFADGLPVKINLIPYNTVEGLDWKRPAFSHCEHFKQILQQSGLATTMRYEKGDDINAACGQLRLKKLQEDQDHTVTTH